MSLNPKPAMETMSTPRIPLAWILRSRDSERSGVNSRPCSHHFCEKTLNCALPLLVRSLGVMKIEKASGIPPEVRNSQA